MLRNFNVLFFFLNFILPKFAHEIKKRTHEAHHNRIQPYTIRRTPAQREAGDKSTLWGTEKADPYAESTQVVRFYLPEREKILPPRIKNKMASLAYGWVV